ncbi:hypothetical protein LLG39_16860 [bacterium]|nr:hypothetical protein [bacterium]
MIDKVSTSERRWVFAWAVAIVVISSLPYLWGILITPKNYHFLGLTHNIDDGAVYLSWMRQAADGHFFIRNLFTSEPQAARAFNLLFLVMGGFARITHLPLIWVFHIFRALLGVTLIWSIWRFSKLFLDNPTARRILIPLVGLSAGVGWLIPGAKAPTGSVDLWQPEAITFLSIYLNPLFLAGLILMLWSLYFLTQTHRYGRVTDAISAGVMLLLLGNIHTYDVITVACVWAAYVLLTWITDRHIPKQTIILSLLAAIIAVPSVWYQFHLYQIDPVFQARANSPTPSPIIWSFFEGYGLVLIGAIIGIITILSASRQANPQSPTPNPHLLLVWSLVGFALPYIPVGQQRKLVMGLHIPLCILCAYALSLLIARIPASSRRAVIIALVALTAVSNLHFLALDLNLLNSGQTVTHYRPFLQSDEMAAIGYLRAHVSPSDAIFAPPDMSIFIPALAGRQVYYGHWSETPDYGSKLGEWADFVRAAGKGYPRGDILASTEAKWLVAYDLSQGISQSLRIKRKWGFHSVRVYCIISPVALE